MWQLDQAMIEGRRTENDKHLQSIGTVESGWICIRSLVLESNTARSEIGTNTGGSAEEIKQRSMSVTSNRLFYLVQQHVHNDKD